MALGRFTVEERLGAGGMGVVHAAHDPQLDRRVAIKVMHASADSPAGQRAQRRLQREARAMAALSHPNVVTVHDVGVHGGHVFVAMELVQGRSLRAWCRQERGWKPVVDVMLAAAEGLLAAHRAGLVHRDFKPDNVLVADDGRVLVGDFGLAALVGPTESAPLSAESDPDDTVRADAGTPGYMAPEQFAGGTISAATDQFAFAVTAWEALFGKRPFAGSSVAELAAAVLAGRIEAPTTRRVPRGVRAALERALCVDASRRWPDMAALIDALKAARAPSRRRRFALGFAGLAGLAVAWLAWPHDPCDAARARAGAAWNPARAQALRTAYAPAPASAAEEHLDRTTAVLDEWLGSWTVAHDAACEGTTEDEVDGRTACLRASLGALEQLVEHLQPDGASPADALSGALSLPSVAACDGSEIAEAEAADPEDRRTERWLEELKARADVLSAAGKQREAVTLLQTGLDAALALGPRDAALRLRLSLAHTQKDLDDPNAAGEALETIYWEAVSAQRDVVAAATAQAVLQARSATLSFAGVETWVQHAESAARRVDGGEGEHTGSFFHALGVLRAAERRHQDALDAFRRALDLTERFDADELRPIKARQNIAAMLILLKRQPEGIAILREVVVLLEARLGPRHPELSSPLVNLAMALVNEGGTDEALELLDRSTTIVEETFGPDSLPAADQQEMRGLVLRDAERFEASMAAFDAARRTKEAHFGGDHPSLASAWFGMAEAASKLDRSEEAARWYQAVIDVLDGREGHEYVLTAALNNLAFNLLEAEQPERAEPVLLRALELADSRGDPVAAALPCVNLGTRRAAQGRPAEAVPYFERALPHLERVVPTESIAVVRVQLADALAESGGDRVRAHALVTEALRTVDEDSDAAKRARKWLETHPPP
jgi:tetratricopeptide (TPR) repeat protein